MGNVGTLEEFKLNGGCFNYEDEVEIKIESKSRH